MKAKPSRRSIVSSLLFAFSFLTLSAASALADIGSYEKMYTVDSVGSTVEKKEYETFALLPVLYLRLPEDGFVFKILKWTAPSGASYSQHFGADDARDNWVSPENWNTIVEKGTWTAEAGYLYTEFPLRVGQSTYSFQVNPEPASVILSVLGFGILAAHYYFRGRRKNAAV